MLSTETLPPHTPFPILYMRLLNAATQKKVPHCWMLIPVGISLIISICYYRTIWRYRYLAQQLPENTEKNHRQYRNEINQNDWQHKIQRQNILNFYNFYLCYLYLACQHRVITVIEEQRLVVLGCAALFSKVGQLYIHMRGGIISYLYRQNKGRGPIAFGRIRTHNL